MTPDSVIYSAFHVKSNQNSLIKTLTVLRLYKVEDYTLKM